MLPVQQGWENPCRHPGATPINERPQIVRVHHRELFPPQQSRQPQQRPWRPPGGFFKDGHAGWIRQSIRKRPPPLKAADMHLELRRVEVPRHIHHPILQPPGFKRKDHVQDFDAPAPHRSLLFIPRHQRASALSRSNETWLFNTRAEKGRGHHATAASKSHAAAHRRPTPR